MPRILEANRHEKFDTKIMRELGEVGLLGATIEGYVRRVESQRLHLYTQSQIREKLGEVGLLGATLKGEGETM